MTFMSIIILYNAFQKVPRYDLVKDGVVLKFLVEKN